MLNTVVGTITNYLTSNDSEKQEELLKKNLIEFFSNNFFDKDVHWNIFGLKFTENVLYSENDLFFTLTLVNCDFYKCDELKDNHFYFRFELTSGNISLGTITIQTDPFNLLKLNIKRYVFKAIMNCLGNKYNNTWPMYYHTIEHVKNSLDCLNNIAFDNSQELLYRRLYMAIVFHDAEYNTEFEDIEKHSAELFREVMTGTIGEIELMNIYRLILSTKFGSDLSDEEEIDKRILHDIDYFGFAGGDYEINTQKIFNEFNGHFTKECLYLGRIEFLSKLLLDLLERNNKLYLTKYFEKYNESALYYIQEELFYMTEKYKGSLI